MRFLPKSVTNGFRRWREQRALRVLRNVSASGISRAGWFTQFRVRNAINHLRGNHWMAVRDWYEGGFPLLTGDQSWLNQVVQDARFDQNFVTRRELMRRMRNHAQDVPIHKRGLDISRQYVIGSHVPVITCLAQSENPESDNNDWCSRAENVWHEETQSIGLNGESLFQLLCIAHDCKKNDGDILFVKVFKKIPMPGRKPGSTQEIYAPALQLIEAHRIETPFNLWEREGKDIIDGVQFRQIEVTGPDGRTRIVTQKIGYWVKDTIDALSFKENYTFIPAEYCFYVGSQQRVNQVRSLSDFYAVETTLHLLRDLLKLEMRAQERQSNYAIFIKNATGQAFDPEMLRKAGMPDVKVSDDGKVYLDRQQAASLYQKMYGGDVYAGFNGDDFTMLAPTRPAEATLNLWDFLINSYCSGAKLPRILIFPKWGKGQGTEVRAELDAANSGFIGEFNLCWKPLMHWIWENFMGWRILNDLRVADPPADWKNIEVSHPRSVLVDAGYDSAATIAEMQAGITNLHFIAQELGTTRKRLIEHSVTDVAMLKVACQRIGKQFKVDIQPGEVRQSLSEVLKNMAAMKTADAAKANAEAQRDNPELATAT